MRSRNLAVIVSIVLLSTLILILDITSGPQRDEEFLYIIPILFTLWIPGKKSTAIVSVASVVLSVIGYWYYVSNFANETGLFSQNSNRLYALIGIFVTAYIVLRNKDKEKIIQKNIVDLNELIEELESSNKELEQYAYVASHDLQEPLRNMTTYIGLVQKRVKHDIDEETAHFLDRISSSAERMRTLIRDILYYSLIGKNRVVENVDCRKVLDTVLTDMASSIQESKAKIIAEPLPVIESIEREITQVFQNLISNAIKFKRNDIPPEIRIRVVDKSTEWEFSIADNGIGIEKEYLNRIFQIFQRLHSKEEYPGTGIGLAICLKIIHIHMGKLWVESRPGVGSTFYFTIPKKQALIAEKTKVLHNH